MSRMLKDIKVDQNVRHGINSATVRDIVLHIVQLLILLEQRLEVL